MSKFKKTSLFTLCFLPFVIGAGIFTTLYQFSVYPQDIIDEAVSQIGSYNLIIVITVVQTVMYAVVSAFAGYLISDYVGLVKPFKIDKRSLAITLLSSATLGIVLFLDHFTFGKIIPMIQSANISSMNFNGFVASVLYGGIVEELMLRLFFMSLIALVIFKLFFRKYTKENIPTKVFVIANIIAALLFAIGHLPATVVLFGNITPVILCRCILLNGGAGFIFGELFRKYGISYAMLGHMSAHIIKYILFAIFL